MTNHTESINLAALRALLLAAFTPEELRRFCYDRPTFRPIVDLFGPGLGAVDMVDRVVEYCDRHVLLGELLAAVKQSNPRQYARFIKPDHAREEPARRPREILTIASPIRLDLVRVPAGEFLMGSIMARDKDAQDNELPSHTVHVPDFYVGQYPVTNIQYQAFVRATGQETPYLWKEGRIPVSKQNHPVVNVSWHDAVAFCDWLNRETKQPFRLPTEAEWEKAARGTDGRIYPWGDDPPDEGRCNFNDNVDDTTTIGRYLSQGDSPYGCADMAGNVWEWCQSLYRPYPYQASDGREDLDTGGARVLRGGSAWSPEEVVRCAFRFWLTPDSRSIIPDYFGFRVCVAAQQD